MKKFGLIGHPIAHSKSPALFAAAYHGEGDMCYELIENESVEAALRRFAEEYDAINVTAPFKEPAFRFADQADTVTSQLGATNLLKKVDGKIKAFNTDFWGVNNILRFHRCDYENPCALVVGCGGAGKAAAMASSNVGFPTYVANRNFARAEEFCKAAGNLTAVNLDDIRTIIDKVNIIIYTLPVMIDCFAQINLKGKLILEANYKDPVLKDICERQGARYLPGQEWLIAQAVAGFIIMTGIQPDERAMKALLL